VDFPDRKPVWQFASGAPGETAFGPVEL